MSHVYEGTMSHTQSSRSDIYSSAFYIYIYIHTHCVPRRRVPRRRCIYIIVRLEGTQISARAPSRHAQMNEAGYTYISLDGYCSTVQGLLDWFEVDLGFTELLFIQNDVYVCVMCVSEAG